MAIKPKKSLNERAKENVNVTKGTSKNQEKIKEGVPLEHHVKQDGVRVVGVNIGITKNMDNYESLRVDCWLTDTIQEGETPEQAYERVLGIVDKVLIDTLESYIDE